jgi:hypothetical protein
MEELRGKDNPKNKKLMEWGKVALYTGALVEMYAGCSYANFETQLAKASDLTLGKLAAMVLGGGAVVGGGLQVKDGNVMKGLGIIAVVGMLGIVIALIKNNTIFSALS